MVKDVETTTIAQSDKSKKLTKCGNISKNGSVPKEYSEQFILQLLAHSKENRLKTRMFCDTCSCCFGNFFKCDKHPKNYKSYCCASAVWSCCRAFQGEKDRVLRGLT